MCMTISQKKQKIPKTKNTKKKSPWNDKALNQNWQVWEESNTLKAYLTALIWFRGGRDACPAAPTLLKRVKLGTTVLLLWEQKKKNLRGVQCGPPGEEWEVSTQLFVPHIHVNSFLIVREETQLFLSYWEWCCPEGKKNRLFKIDSARLLWFWSSYFSCLHMQTYNISGRIYIKT